MAERWIDSENAPPGARMLLQALPELEVSDARTLELEAQLTARLRHEAPAWLPIRPGRPVAFTVLALTGAAAAATLGVRAFGDAPTQSLPAAGLERKSESSKLRQAPVHIKSNDSLTPGIPPAGGSPLADDRDGHTNNDALTLDLAGGTAPAEDAAKGRTGGETETQAHGVSRIHNGTAASPRQRATRKPSPPLGGKAHSEQLVVDAVRALRRESAPAKARKLAARYLAENPDGRLAQEAREVIAIADKTPAPTQRPVAGSR